jgi:hypothetical protein
MKKNRVIAGVLAGIALSVAMGATAEAAPAQPDGVSATTLELYSDFDYDTHWLHGGVVRYFTASSDDLERAQVGDAISSLKNTTPSAWVVYEHQEFKGAAYCVKPGQQIPDMRAKHAFNDKMSSVKRLAQTTCAGYTAW